MVYIFIDLLFILFTFFILFFEYCKWMRSYWQNRHVVCLEKPLTLKSFPKVLRSKFFPEKEVEDIYKGLKTNGLKHGGAYIFTKPVYVPVTTTFLEKVLVHKSTDLFPKFEEVKQDWYFQNLSEHDLVKVLDDVDVKKKLERCNAGVKINIKSAVDLFLDEYKKIMWKKKLKRFGGNTGGGFGKVPETLCKCLEEIAKAEELKKDLILAVQGGNDYLTSLILETIRMYPILPYLTKKCVNALRVPGTDVLLEKGTVVLVAVSGIHSDSDNFVQPDFFNPQRFSKQNVTLINKNAFWNPYNNKEMEFLKHSLKALVKNGILDVI